MKGKRILAAFLAVLTLLSCMAVSASAERGDPESYYAQAYSDTGELLHYLQLDSGQFDWDGPEGFIVNDGRRWIRKIPAVEPGMGTVDYTLISYRTPTDREEGRGVEHTLTIEYIDLDFWGKVGRFFSDLGYWLVEILFLGFLWGNDSGRFPGVWNP
ncbi:MAG: hypothetical protein LBR73_06195 [Oscillospiraceae bacterium]|jgi:hypothetical protein|nr:hypothetical protein [Oscillospiraceae bacterium]